MCVSDVVVINSDWFLGYFVGNTLWLIAIGYYLYITFLGYSGKSQPVALFSATVEQQRMCVAVCV